MAITEDHVLGGRVLLRQMREGLRVAIDPILLAAAVPAEPGEIVLDLGTGNGVAALCLARRCAGCRVVGLELQPELMRQAAENATLNGLDAAVSVMVGDVGAPPPRLAPATFHHVMANPPYLKAGTGTVPANPLKALAIAEGDADLAVWIRTALAMVRPRGTISIIHRADRLDALLAAFGGRAGEIVVFPLWPNAGKSAKRVLVHARRDSGAPLRLAPGLVLHDSDGRFTPEADAILRDAAALAL
jgi:tRNA1(Val) A37 N6-methylase TrmN6